MKFTLSKEQQILNHIAALHSRQSTGHIAQELWDGSLEGENIINKERPVKQWMEDAKNCENSLILVFQTDFQKITREKNHSFKFKMLSSLLGKKYSDKWLKNQQFHYLVQEYMIDRPDGLTDLFSFMSSIYEPDYQHTTKHHRILDQLFYQHVHQFDQEYTGKPSQLEKISHVIESLNNIIKSGNKLTYSQLTEFLFSESGKDFFVFGRAILEEKSGLRNEKLYEAYPELSEFIIEHMHHEDLHFHIYNKWLNALEECSVIDPQLYINMRLSKNGRQILKKTYKASPYRFLNTLTYFNTWNCFHLFNSEMIDLDREHCYQKTTECINNVFHFLDKQPYSTKGNMDTILRQHVLDTFKETKYNMVRSFMIFKSVYAFDSHDNTKKTKEMDINPKDKSERVEQMSNNIRLLPEECVAELHVIHSAYKKIQEQLSFINESEKNDLERMFRIKVPEIIEVYLSIEKDYRYSKIGVQGKNATELMMASLHDIEATFHHILEDINSEKLTQLSVQQRYINTIKNQYVNHSEEEIKDASLSNESETEIELGDALLPKISSIKRQKL